MSVSFVRPEYLTPQHVRNCRILGTLLEKSEESKQADLLTRAFKAAKALAGGPAGLGTYIQESSSIPFGPDCNEFTGL
jgi:hypothetical protein